MKAATTASKRAPRAAAAGAAEAPVVRFRLRVSRGEAISVGPGKIALLEAIQRSLSITAAAKSLGMSYRRAWILVDEVNAAMRQPAVASSIGGEGGGGSNLTAAGVELVALYRRIEARAAKSCADDIERMLKLLLR